MFHSDVEITFDKLDEVAMFAWALLEEHLPNKGWVFEYNRGLRNLGRCIPSRKTIQISYNYVLNNRMELIHDTLLHEIAHALVGCGNGHNHVWKAMCRKIGCRPVRCKNVEETGLVIKYKYKSSCPSCGGEFKMHRLTQRMKRHNIQGGTRCARCNVPITKWEEVSS